VKAHVSRLFTMLDVTSRLQIAIVRITRSREGEYENPRELVNWPSPVRVTGWRLRTPMA
jgi:hypothetical protein